MSKIYGYCIECGSSQKNISTCKQCNSAYVIARDSIDYEVHLYDLYDENPDNVKPGVILQKPDVLSPSDPEDHPSPSSLPPANNDLRFVGSEKADLQIVDQTRETWTRTGDPKTTRLTLWDKNVKNMDVDPKNFSTKNDGHELPADGPARPEKAVPAPVGGSMDNKETTVAVYTGEPGKEQPDSLKDSHTDGSIVKGELESIHNADTSVPDPVPSQGCTEQPDLGNAVVDEDPHHNKPEADTKNIEIGGDHVPEAAVKSDSAIAAAPAVNQPANHHSVEGKVPGAPASPADPKDNRPSVPSLQTDPAKLAQKSAKARMQKFLKPSDNYTAPNKEGNVDLLPNMGSNAGPATAAGVPTTRSPAGDNINDHHIEVTDKDGAPIKTVPSATNLDTPTGVVQVRTDENKTVIVTQTDDYKGNGDTPGDATTRGPDADKITTRDTVVIKDDSKNLLLDRRVKGAMAINVFKFSKAFWKSAEAVMTFMINEGTACAYTIDGSGKVVNQITDQAGYYEMTALATEYFVAGSFVEHCIANFGGECAILAVSGEVKSTPDPNYLPQGAKVDSVAVSTKINTAFTAYHVKRAISLEGEVARSNTRLKEIENILIGVLDDKARLTDELKAVKAELAEKVAQAKLDARLNDIPSVVKAELKRNPNREDILKYLRNASDQEWDVARRTFALASKTSFAELSEIEGKLPVGGGSTNENKTLQEYLR